MFIASADIALEGKHHAVQLTEEKESLRTWGPQGRRSSSETQTNRPDQPNRPSNLFVQSDVISISRQAMAFAEQASVSRSQISEEDVKEAVGEAKVTGKYELTKMVLEQLFGVKLKNIEFEADPEEDNPDRQPPDGGNGPQPGAGFGMEYTYSRTEYDAEQTSFHANGTVTTADGREINFEVGLRMEREYYHHEEVSLRVGAPEPKLKDPLVLNFDGGSAELTDTKFSFDLDADGETENISFLRHGSGFLALDLNKNGTIDNGSELFGPTTGDGFAELAAYDEDGNHFIDEADSVYSQLRIYNKDSEGQDTLQTLKERNVGAIYLEKADTPFTIKNEQNETQAQVQASSVFLEEDGGVGTVQQIDLAV